MKKICIITTAHPAGDNRIYHREIKSLLKKYKVIYITTEGQVENLKNCELRYIGGWNNHLSRLVGNIKAFSVAYNSGADLFHFHDPEFVPFGILLKWLKRRPVIYDIHEDYPAVVMGRGWIPKYLRRLTSTMVFIGEKLTLPLLTQLITASSRINSRYSKINKHSLLIENYPSDEIINKFFVQKKKKDIVCLGDLNEIRGARVVFSAISIFLKDNLVNFYLLGDIKPESLKRDLLKGVSEDVSPRVKIMGRRNYEDAIKFASKAGVGLLSYMKVPNHLNASPNKLYEYMGLGLAVVYTDLPNYISALKGDIVGLCYRNNSSEDLVRALKEMYDGPISLEEMQNNGRRLFLEKYNWKGEERKLLSIYGKLLKECI